MIFVNRVADFVHRSVSENDGFPNKNVGDAFQASGEENWVGKRAVEKGPFQEVL